MERVHGLASVWTRRSRSLSPAELSCGGRTAAFRGCCSRCRAITFSRALTTEVSIWLFVADGHVLEGLRTLPVDAFPGVSGRSSSDLDKRPQAAFVDGLGFLKGARVREALWGL